MANVFGRYASPAAAVLLLTVLLTGCDSLDDGSSADADSGGSYQTEGADTTSYSNGSSGYDAQQQQDQDQVQIDSQAEDQSRSDQIQSDLEDQDGY